MTSSDEPTLTDWKLSIHAWLSDRTIPTFHGGDAEPRDTLCLELTPAAVRAAIAYLELLEIRLAYWCTAGDHGSERLRLSLLTKQGWTAIEIETSPNDSEPNPLSLRSAEPIVNEMRVQMRGLPKPQ